MNWDADDLEIAYWCATVAIQSRRENRKPIPDELRRHIGRLDLAIRCMSSRGHEIEGVGSPLRATDWITTREAAAILNKSERQTRRLKDDLDGQIIGDRLQFPRSSVETYAHERMSA